MSRLSFASYDVVHVAETIRGGIATYLREILPLQRERYGARRVAVIAPADQVADLGEQPGIAIIPIASSGSRLLMAYKVRGALSRLATTASIDTIHVHSTFAGISCRLLSWNLRCKQIVYCPHGWSFIREGRGAVVARSMERILSRACDAIICVSEFEKSVALAAGLAPSKLNVIRNALPKHVPCAAPLPAHWQSGALRLIFVGRFDRAKGFDVLLGALQILSRDVEVHVFGASVLGDTSAIEIPPNVHLHGWQPFESISPYLATCDALVMPSRWEAIGLAAIEAMRAGKAVIASRAGGLPEVVEDGETGHLFPVGDCEALAQIIECVDQAALSVMGMRGQARFLANFQIDQCEKRLAELYAA